MTTPVIIDAIVAVVFIVFVLSGARRGLFRALAGFLSMIVALVGANLVAGAMITPVEKAVTPRMETKIEEKIDEALTAHAPQVPNVPTGSLSVGSFSVEELLNLVGLDDTVRDSLTQKAQELVKDTGVSVVMAVTQSIAHSVIYSALYGVSFVLLTIALHFLVRVMDGILKFPVLHQMNALGGGAIGVVQALLLVYLAIWVAQRMGVSFTTEPVSATHLLKFFAAHTPLRALSFLQ